MVPLLFLDLRTVLGDGRHGWSWGAQGWLSLAPALAPAPCTTSARNQVPGRAKDRSWAGGEGVSLGSGQDLYSPSCSSPPSAPHLLPKPITHPVSQLSYTPNSSHKPSFLLNSFIHSTNTPRTQSVRRSG